MRMEKLSKDKSECRGKYPKKRKRDEFESKQNWNFLTTLPYLEPYKHNGDESEECNSEDSTLSIAGDLTPSLAKGVIRAKKQVIKPKPVFMRRTTKQRQLNRDCKVLWLKL